LNKLSNKYPIRYLEKGHTNAPDKRNRAINEAKNPWILWLDSDDILFPDVIRMYRNVVKKYPDVDVLYGNLKLIGNIKAHGNDRMLFKDYHGKNELLLNHLFYANRIPNPGHRKAMEYLNEI
jgi:glycosyltransferase involved in cell wall biosynthesis